MSVTITASGVADIHGEVAALRSWLNLDDSYRGRVEVVRNAVEPGEMGSVADTLVVALGVGGAGTALINTLALWIKTRRSAVRLKVREAGGREIELEADNLKDIDNIIERFGRAGD